ncbi:ABC transporter permease [Arthrobacter sp. EH-1B-1]|uniref:ABC transporter permease n=1 Tax=Arthrobacter vasquezii TaxID=2977629 RepID=A0ABT6CTN8_9MICC|nr:ABC transporter permease [Arthrobacter vasquezii]MDF9277429.1 ABC transporter permease [Arthrobacter vasquezii]
MSVTTETRPDQAGRVPASEQVGAILRDRTTLLVVLTVVMIVVFSSLGANGYLLGPFNVSYLLSSLISLVPVALLALAQTFVILSGRSGIDLSVGGMVSLGGMVFASLVGPMGWDVLPAAAVTIVAGGIFGALNGWLVGYVGFPPLIATLATSYIFGSLALLLNDGSPISGPRVAATNSITSNIPLGTGLFLPTHVLTILLPAIVITWFALSRTSWGRSLYAVGTNDVAATYATLPVKRIRASAYVASGLLCGVTAIVNVAQFASARPDAGSAGNGLALPAITIAVLGGVAIHGGRGRISGTVIAALLITWLNAALLISFTGSSGPRAQLLALGLLLVGAVFLNTVQLPKSRRRRWFGLAPNNRNDPGKSA